MYKEKQVKMYQADLLEECSEHLSLRTCHWLFDGRELTNEIKEFVDWCLEQDKIDLHAKRGHDGKSFYERREEAKKAIREHQDNEGVER